MTMALRCLKLCPSVCGHRGAVLRAPSWTGAHSANARSTAYNWVLLGHHPLWKGGLSRSCHMQWVGEGGLGILPGFETISEGPRAPQGIHSHLYWNHISVQHFPTYFGGSDGKDSSCKWETKVWSLSQEDPLEKWMATHSTILAWRIPQTEESGGLVHGIAKSQTQLSDTYYLLTLLFNIENHLIHQQRLFKFNLSIIKCYRRAQSSGLFFLNTARFSDRHQCTFGCIH